MAASDSELQDDAEDGLAEGLAAGVEEYRVRDRMVKRRPLKEQLETLLMLRGLQSANRGVNLGKVDKPA